MNTSIKICSYNIHKGFAARKNEFILPEIREALSNLDIDIAFLQEVQGKHSRRKLKKIQSEDEPQMEYLAGDNWPHFIYGKNAVYGGAHHGNGFLSQFPFVSWNNIDVSFAQRASRLLLHGLIELPSKTRLHVMCIHLGLFKIERNIQLTTLCKTIKKNIPSTAPLIIAGDFNDWRRHAGSHLEDELDLDEVYKELHGSYAKTYPAKRPAFEVDRIYYRGLDLLQAEVLQGEPWETLSDHLPLYAEFKLSAEPKI